MSKIKWAGIIKSEEDFPAAKIPIPENAKQLGAEESMASMQIHALPFLVPSVLLIFISMFFKVYTAEEFSFSVPFFFLGFIIGFMLIIVHELLHAIAYPKEATVYIGILPKGLAAVALSTSPISKRRFIFISILPAVLGLIPLIFFLLIDSSQGILNGLFFGMAAVGLTTIYPDLYNIYHICKNVPKNATILNDKTETYYY